MTTAYTSLLGLALPTTGELQGTWGDTVNNSITSLLDTAVAGTTTLSTDGDVTLSTTTGAANQARQAILLCSGARTALRTITAPAASKIYTVINATTGGYAVKIVGVGPTTGISIPAGQTAQVAWNGSDFVDASNYTNGNKYINGNLTVTGTTTLSGGTANGVAYLNGSKVVTTGSALTFDGTTLTSVNNSTSSSILLSRTSAVARNWALGVDGDGGFRLTDSTGSVVVLSALPSGVTFLASESELAFKYNSSTEGMRLTSTGLGIGTSSPGAKLEVTGNILQTWASTHNRFVGTQYSTTYENGLRFLEATRETQVIAKAADTGGLITFFTGTTPSERMRLDGSGNVGIGTTSPAQKLQVGDGTATANWARIYGTVSELYIGQNTGVSHFGLTNAAKILSIANYPLVMGTANAYDLVFGTNNTERMRLDSSGNLGLGVTPSAWSTFKTLQIASGSVAAVGTQTQFIQNAYFDGTNWKYINSSGALRYGIDTFANAHYWYNAPSGTAGTNISFTQAMTLDASGNLGIGATSPGCILDVQSASPIVKATATTGTNTVSFRVVNTGGTSYFARDNSTGGFTGTAYATFVWGNGAYPMVFATNDIERARIDSSGNLLIGTTTQGYGLFTSSRVTLGNGGAGDGFCVGGINEQLSAYTVQANNNTGTRYALYIANGSSVPVGTVSFTSTGTAYNTSSDYRLKNTIAPMTGALAKVALLKPCTYKWNADGSDGEGFIAHELAEVVPQCVTGEKDAVDAEGKPVYQGIDTSFLVATLTAAIQEQQVLITQLQARLDAANL